MVLPFSSIFAIENQHLVIKKTLNMNGMIVAPHKRLGTKLGGIDWALHQDSNIRAVMSPNEGEFLENPLIIIGIT